ncbi:MULTISPECIES: cold-shock protein [unclassified Mesorhizobium]|uniref:cold-shock protein n=1 Tax=unclassified Mesorhizobium TaxID=325217 RepID=UPI001FDF42F0|nr:MULTISPECIES: cold shock domain-containing protein [unclassified Mesorhizobium]
MTRFLLRNGLPSQATFCVRHRNHTRCRRRRDLVQHRRGFGFVKLPEGIETHPRAAGGREPRCFRGKASQGHDGRKSKRSPGLSGAGVDRETQLHTRSAREPAAGRVPNWRARARSSGTIRKKGFGFLAPENREKDIFVPATALTRSGLSTPIEGQKVFVQCGQGKKGLEVRSIRLA